MKKILLSADWVLPIESKPISNGALLVQDDEILEVGLLSELLKKYPQVSTKHFFSALLMPGFVNTHCHSAYTVLRHVVPAGPFSNWLAAMVELVRTQKLTENDFLVSSRAGFEELLSSGVTTVADSGPSNAPLSAFQEVGLRGIFYKEIFGFQEKDPVSLPGRLSQQVQKLKLPDTIQFGLAPHSPYTMPPTLLTELSQLCLGEKIPITLHVAESPEEAQFFQNGDGALSALFPDRNKLIPRARSPIQYLDSNKVLNERLLAVHCVQVNEEDIQILMSRKVPIAYCPTSNAQLKVGEAPVAQFLRNQLTVGLGTDGATSVPSLNFFSTLRDATHFGKLSSEEVLHMATLGGAKALNLDNQIGSLRPGKKADLLAVKLSETKNIHQTLVQKGQPEDILFVMVNGKTLKDETL